MEHITKGASLALGGCGLENILREIAKRADRKELDQAKRELDQLRTENAHLHAYVAAMSEERGDSEIPCKADDGLPPDPGTSRASG